MITRKFSGVLLLVLLACSLEATLVDTKSLPRQDEAVLRKQASAMYKQAEALSHKEAIVVYNELSHDDKMLMALPPPQRAVVLKESADSKRHVGFYRSEDEEYRNALVRAEEDRICLLKKLQKDDEAFHTLAPRDRLDVHQDIVVSVRPDIIYGNFRRSGDHDGKKLARPIVPGLLEYYKVCYEMFGLNEEKDGELLEYRVRADLGEAGADDGAHEYLKRLRDDTEALNKLPLVQRDAVRRNMGDFTCDPKMSKILEYIDAHYVDGVDPEEVGFGEEASLEYLKKLQKELAEEECMTERWVIDPITRKKYRVLPRKIATSLKSKFPCLFSRDIFKRVSDPLIQKLLGHIATHYYADVGVVMLRYEPLDEMYAILMNNEFKYGVLNRLYKFGVQDIPGRAERIQQLGEIYSKIQESPARKAALLQISEFLGYQTAMSQDQFVTLCRDLVNTLTKRAKELSELSEEDLGKLNLQKEDLLFSCGHARVPKKIFRTAALLFHPDKNNCTPTSTELMQLTMKLSNCNSMSHEIAEMNMYK